MNDYGIGALRRKAAMFGEETLTRHERQRLEAADDEDRRRTAQAQQEREKQERAINQENAELRAEVAALREELATLTAWRDAHVVALNEEVDKIIGEIVDRFEDNENAVVALRNEVRTGLAEVRVEGLRELQALLVSTAKMAIDVNNEATSLAVKKVETAQTEAAERERLAALEAKNEILEAQIERIRTHKDFRFFRESDDVSELPVNYFPPSRRTN